MQKILIVIAVTCCLVGCEKKTPKVIDKTEIPIEKILERELSDEVRVVILRAQESGVTGMTEQQITATIQQAEARMKAEAEQANEPDSDSQSNENAEATDEEGLSGDDQQPDGNR